MILMEGLFLILFSQMNSAMLAIITMTVFALFTHMACGATYALVPFIDRDALGVWLALSVQAVTWVRSQQDSYLKACWIFKPV